MRWPNLLKSTAGRWLITAIVSLVHLSCVIQPAHSEESLRSELGDVDLDPIWLYDDWQSAQAAAQRTGQPIFVVFR